MKRAFELRYGLVGIVVLAILSLWLILVFSTQARTTAQPDTQQLTLTPTRVVTATVPALPVTPTPAGPSIIVLEGVIIQARKAAFLRNKDLWVIESGRGERAVTTFGDVSAIFGWNKDATMLLFGRGRKTQRAHVGDTTELWMINVATNAARQLTVGSNVRTAAWSPIDDRIAFCEQDNALKVAGVDGKISQQLSNAMCFFAWSPDGASIAAVTITPESIDERNVEIYDFLTIWQPVNGTARVFKTERGLIYEPIWSMDGKSLIFQLSKSGSPQSLWHVADVLAGLVRQIQGSPKIVADFVSRSPRADVLVYRADGVIYAMDFLGQLQIVDSGRSPVWLPSGKTVIYRSNDGRLKVGQRDFASPMPIEAGGSLRAIGLYSQLDYFLAR